jgi:hypothetical protein
MPCHHWERAITATQKKRWSGTATLQPWRSIGNRLTKRKMIGVKTAQGSQSRILGRIVIIQGPPVSRTSLAPRTNATIPHPAKDKAQLFNKETNSPAKLVRPFASFDIKHSRAKRPLPPLLPENTAGLWEVVDFDEADAVASVYARE